MLFCFLLQTIFYDKLRKKNISPQTHLKYTVNGINFSVVARIFFFFPRTTDGLSVSISAYKELGSYHTTLTGKILNRLEINNSSWIKRQTQEKLLPSGQERQTGKHTEAGTSYQSRI